MFMELAIYSAFVRDKQMSKNNWNIPKEEHNWKQTSWFIMNFSYIESIVLIQD